jgi:glycosyltransferase involved in cell wall biosynthesis
MTSIANVLVDDVELIVIADGEGDGTWRIAREYPARVHKINGPAGPARVRNYGASLAQGDILFFVDADVTVHPNVLERLRGHFLDSSIAAVIGSYDDQPEVPDFVSQYRNLLHHYVHQSSDEEASTFWGACGAVRRHVFLQVGGFDDSYAGPAIEDIALGYQLCKAGFRIRLDKGLYVKHLKQWTLMSMIVTDLFQRAIPWTRLILVDRKFINDLNLRTSSRASVGLAYVTLLSMFAAFIQPAVLIITAAGLALLLALNFDVYRFYYKVRGLWFALRVIPLHFLYYLYSGLGFVTGMLIYVIYDRRSGQSTDTTSSINEEGPGS